MICPSEYDLSQIDWDSVLRTPELFKHLIPESGRLPDWLVELREARLAKPNDVPVIKKKPQIRDRDCSRWIKKSNYQVIRVRKRKPEARIPILLNPSLKTMRPVSLAQHQRHSAHLMSRVLNIRTNASPFTLILDDLNQGAIPVVGELVRRGLSRNVNVVVVSFEATRFHPAVRNILAYGQVSGDQILQDIRKAMADAKESLVIIDSLYDLLNTANVDMNTLFKLVAGEFASTLVGIRTHHTRSTSSSTWPRPS
jgi:elongator complex protein 5